MTAAQACSDFEISGYNDWYLPSQYELIEMYNTISIGGHLGNIGGFESIMVIILIIGLQLRMIFPEQYVYILMKLARIDPDGKYFTKKVRPIRSFGNWTMGCMDSLACNYNSQANMADESCSFAEEGYDCDGNELQFSLSFDGVDDYVDLPS